MIFKDVDKVIVELIEIGNCCAMVYIFKLIISRLKFEKSIQCLRILVYYYFYYFADDNNWLLEYFLTALFYLK